MVIVESVALAIMVSNDIVVPLMLKRRERLITEGADVGRMLLTVRRVAIVVILLLAYLYYRSAGAAQLASIGLLSFAAIAQLAPAFFGGLFWRRATARGAMAGMTIGIVIWAYTLLLPSFADAGLVAFTLLSEGPWGIALLRPQALFGLELPPLLHGVVWSLSLNIIAYIGFSLSRAPASIERLQGDLFVPSDLTPISPTLPPVAPGGDDRGTEHHRRALSRRGAHPHLVRQLCLDAAASCSIPRPRPTSSSSAMPSICSPRRSAPPPRVSCCRCCCASARCRPRPRSSSSTTPMRRSTTTAKSCRPRSTTSARASRCSTRTCT